MLKISNKDKTIRKSPNVRKLLLQTKFNKCIKFSMFPFVFNLNNIYDIIKVQQNILLEQSVGERNWQTLDKFAHTAAYLFGLNIAHFLLNACVKSRHWNYKLVSYDFFVATLAAISKTNGVHQPEKWWKPSAEHL